MTGGAIPVFAWGVLLTVLFIANTIWNHRLMDSLASAFAALVIFLFGAALIVLAGRRAVRRGEPEASPAPAAVTTTSVGAAVAGLALAILMFGFVFGSFLIYFGGGLLVLALGRVVVERRAERASLAALEQAPGEEGRR